MTGDDDDDEIGDLAATRELARRDRTLDIRLKKVYAFWLLGALVTQLVVANAVFVVYAHVGMAWRLSTLVVDIWLAATIIEIVGIVYVVTKYLFPRRDLQP